MPRPDALQAPRQADARFILGAALVASLGTFGLHLLLPSLPEIGARFAVATGATQLLVSGAMLAIAAGNLLIGPLSDRYGRRAVSLAALALFVAGSAVGALADSFGVLLLGRIVQAFGGGAATAVVRATLVDRFGAERGASAIAYSATAVLVVPMFAPTLGGLAVEHWGWRAPFGLAAAIGVAIMLYAWRRVAETHSTDARVRLAARAHAVSGAGAGAVLGAPVPGAPVGRPADALASAPRGTLASYRELLHTPQYLRYVMFGSFLLAAVYVYISSSPHVAIELYGVRPAQYGAWAALPALASFSGFLIAGRISRRRGNAWMMRRGLVLSVVAALAVAAPVALGWWVAPALFVPAMLVCMSNALSTPNSTSAAISLRPDIAGAASGLLGFVQLMISALAAQLVAQFENGTPWPPAIAILVLNALALVTFRGIR